MARFARKLLHLQQCRLACLALPERTRIGSARAASQPFGRGKMMGDVIGQKPWRNRVGPVDHRREPDRPGGGRGIGAGGCPVGDVGRGGEHRPVTPKVQLQIASQAQVIAARGAGGHKRMLQQRKENFRRQPAAEKPRHLPEQSARRGHAERQPGAVIGVQPPAIQHGRDLPRQ